MGENASFNLVDEPWIRTRFRSGETKELSLLDVFRNAGEIDKLANDLPTQDFAILRVLLAILQRSVVGNLNGDEDPTEVWSELWESESLPMSEIESYLEQWRHRFDLFDPEAPFMQVAGMHTSKDEISPIGKIVADMPDGAAFFTMRHLDGAKRLSYPEAARWLIHAHAFDTAGIKSGVVGDASVKGGKSYSTGYPGWAGCLGGLHLEDSSLDRTLLINLVLWSDRANDDLLLPLDDIPTWEQIPKTPGDDNRTPKGFADLYTWQSRRVLLKEDKGEVIGVVLTNGDKFTPYNKQHVEPMTAWRRSPNQEKKLGIALVHFPATHKSERALWRSLDSILPSLPSTDNNFIAPGIVDWLNHLQECQALPDDHMVHMHATGVEYGTQNSVVTDVIDDAVALNVFLLGPMGHDANALVRDVLKRTDAAVYAFGLFARNLRIASGDDDRAGSAKSQAQANAYYELDALFRAWLAKLAPDADLHNSNAEWNSLARRSLLSLKDERIRNLDPKSIAGHSSRAGWMTAAKAESIFLYKLNELLPFDASDKEGEQ